MKRFKYIQPVLILTIVVAVAGSCGVKRHPGSAYMPDMAYSRAYETYILRDTSTFTNDRDSANKYHKIFYNNRPVAGTMRMGEMMPYEIANDTPGYIASAAVKNPLPPLTPADSAEAGRLYNINCGICHGEGGKADGPIAQRIGAVANLTSPAIAGLADGTMFHSITYGKGNMGSYASQLTRHQRWMIIQYVRTLQAGVVPAAATTTPATATTGAITKPAADTAKKNGK